MKTVRSVARESLPALRKNGAQTVVPFGQIAEFSFQKVEVVTDFVGNGLQ